VLHSREAPGVTHKHPQITAVKMLIVLAPGACDGWNLNPLIWVNSSIGLPNVLLSLAKMFVDI
jgi:hypothetical protein